MTGHEYSDYRHPKHAAAAALLRAGRSAADTASTLGMGLRAVYRVRGIEGLPSFRAGTEALEDKLERHCLPPDHEGHVFWDGPVAGGSNTGVIKVGEHRVQASHIAFEMRTARRPVGMCLPECGEPQCIAPEHLSDEIERRKVRLFIRSMNGLDGPWTICPAGLHEWDRYGRVEPDGKLYCVGCNTDRVRNRRARDRKEAS